MIDPIKVGNTIATIRKANKLTQLELSEKLNITHQAVSKWERGESLPDLESIYNLSRVFNMRIDDIINGEHTVEAPMMTITVENIGGIWEQALTKISERLSKPSFDTWIRHTTAIVDHDVITIISPNLFSTEWLKSRYNRLVHTVLSEITGMQDLKISFESAK